MEPDRTRWNRKYAERAFNRRPTPIVVRYAKLAPAGRALDIAAGNGRHALFLANLGFAVDAVDIADAGLKLFACKHPRVRPVCADLDRFDIAPQRYRLIVNIKFLQRRLFPGIAAGLVAGGVLIFETFVRSARHRPPRPFRPQHLLDPGELGRAFPALETVFYRETPSPAPGDPYPLASLVAVRPGPSG
jgi:tellurite methyltransferase